MFYNKFEKIHSLLKEYNCRPTFDFCKEYQEPGGILGKNGFFYATLKELQESISGESIGGKKNWQETIDAELDVIINTKWHEAPKKQIRFDITYSKIARKYSMHISLPTSGKSIPLSADTYKTEQEVIQEIEKWLNTAKCKKKTQQVTDQLSLF